MAPRGGGRARPGPNPAGSWHDALHQPRPSPRRAFGRRRARRHPARRRQRPGQCAHRRQPPSPTCPRRRPALHRGRTGHPPGPGEWPASPRAPPHHDGPADAAGSPAGSPPRTARPAGAPAGQQPRPPRTRRRSDPSPPALPRTARHDPARARAQRLARPGSGWPGRPLASPGRHRGQRADRSPTHHGASGSWHGAALTHRPRWPGPPPTRPSRAQGRCVCRARPSQPPVASLRHRERSPAPDAGLEAQ